jgi:hypothetical protein
MEAKAAACIQDAGSMEADDIFGGIFNGTGIEGTLNFPQQKSSDFSQASKHQEGYQQGRRRRSGAREGEAVDQEKQEELNHGHDAPEQQQVMGRRRRRIAGGIQADNEESEEKDMIDPWASTEARRNIHS